MTPRARNVLSSDDSSTLVEQLLSEGASENNGAVIERPQISRNVPLALAYTAFVFAGRSVWSQSVLSTFVFLVRQEDYRAVGFITAVMGVAQLITSFPSGYLADRYRRDTLLRVASAVALGAIVSTLHATYTSNYHSLVVGLAIWGSYWGISNTAMSAIFADSIPTGQRSKYFTQRSLLVNAGFATGPAVSLILFAVLGDKWGISDCAIVLAVGQAICFPAVVILWFLSDDHIVPPDDNNQNNAAASQRRDQSNNNEESPTDNDREISTGEAVQITGESDETDFFCSCFPRSRRIAILIATGDLMSGLASGMSIRYFPIFFVENLHMGPVLTQVLYILTPLFLAGCMKMAQYLSTRFGRCRVSVSFKWTGIVLMWVLVATYKLGQPRWVVCTIYIIRTAFINSTGALTRSVLMDNVPPSERGRWAALESLNMFSWSGSAALGGYLVGVIGMVPLFCTTAGIQFLASFPLLALSLEEKLEGDTSVGEAEVTGNSAMQYQLLTETEGEESSGEETSAEND